MQTVMGASPMPKFAICCGTLSSRIRKLPRGMLGMKWPLLSSTATSTLTTLVSTLKLGASGGRSALFLLLNLEGILGWSESGALASFLRGLATVSPTSFLGPSSWAGETLETAASTTTKPNEIFCQVLIHRSLQLNDISIDEVRPSEVSRPPKTCDC